MKTPIFGLLLLLCLQNVFASTTGEITGWIYDTRTREKIANATIEIIETGQKISSDDNGYFHFLGISANSWSLQISQDGFQTKILKNVVVLPEVTTPLSILLAPQIAGEPEEKAQPQICQPARIHPDKVAFWQPISAKEIEHLPTSFTELPREYGQTRSLVQTYIPRYFSIENVFNEGRTVLTEGSTKTNGFLRYSTNDVGSRAFQKNLGHRYTTLIDRPDNKMYIDDFYHPDRLKYAEFFLSTPLPFFKQSATNLPKLKAIFAGEIFDTAGMFPNEDDHANYLHGALIYRPQPNARLTFSVSHQWQNYTIYSHYWKNTTREATFDSTSEVEAQRDLNGDGQISGWVPGTDLNHDGELTDEFSLLDHLPHYENSETNFNLNWIHNLSPRLYYEINLDRAAEYYHYNVEENINEDTDGDGHLDLTSADGIDLDGDGDNIHEDINGNGVWDWQIDGGNTDLYRDENNNGYIDASEQNPREEWIGWEDILFGHSRDTNSFYLYGRYENLSYPPERWGELHSDTYRLNAQMTWQVVDNSRWASQFKTGIQGKYQDYRTHEIYLPSGGLVDRMNCAIFPNTSGFFIRNKTNVRRLLPYIYQASLVCGLRYERYDSNLPDYINPTALSPDTTEITPNSELLPRIGISLSFTQFDQFYYHYQKSADVPVIQFFYLPDNDLSALQFTEPQIIQENEIGAEFNLLNIVKFETAGFWQKFSLFTPPPIITEDIFSVYNQFDEGKYWGFRVSLQIFPVYGFSCRLNYTNSEAKSDPGQNIQNYESSWTGNIVLTNSSYLDWDRRNQFSGYLNYQVSEQSGFQIGGLHPFGGLNLTLKSTFLSGLPYSPPQRSREPEINTKRLPDIYWFDLKIQKSFSTGSLNYTLFCEIQNLFDRKNIFQVANTEWYDTYKKIYEDFSDGILTIENYMKLMDQQDPFDVNGDGITDNQQDGEIDYNKLHPEAGKDIDPTVYGPRRRIYFGVKVAF